MEDHWLPRPDVDPARARLMWFMLVGDCPQVAELARLGQRRLAGLDGLDRCRGGGCTSRHVWWWALPTILHGG